MPSKMRIRPPAKVAWRLYFFPKHCPSLNPKTLKINVHKNMVGTATKRLVSRSAKEIGRASCRERVSKSV